VTSFVGPEQLSGALYGCHLVLIPAGVPRKPGMTRDDLFNINAGAEGVPACLARLVWLGVVNMQGLSRLSFRVCNKRLRGNWHTGKAIVGSFGSVTLA